MVVRVKDLERSPWGEGGETSSLYTYTPCILEASFKPLRGLSSVTFGQACHLSLGLCNRAQNSPSRAPAILTSQPLCSKDHQAGGQVGSGVRPVCFPSSALPTTPDSRCWMPVDCMWPTNIYVLPHTGF